MGNKEIKKLINEQQVLKKLGIKDFRHMSKDKVVEFISMLPYMDTEVAKAAVEQFPEFAKTMKSITCDYKAEIEAGLKSNDESIKNCYEASKTVLNSLDKMLDKDNLTYDEKMEITDRMMTIIQSMNDKDSENKKFVRDILGIAALVLVSVVGITATLLGGNTKFPNNKG